MLELNLTDRGFRSR